MFYASTLHCLNVLDRDIQYISRNFKSSLIDMFNSALHTGNTYYYSRGDLEAKAGSQTFSLKAATCIYSDITRVIFLSGLSKQTLPLRNKCWDEKYFSKSWK